MRLVLLALVATLISGGVQAQTTQSSGQAPPGQAQKVPPWRVYGQLASGQNTYCAEGGSLWVFEGNGAFALNRQQEAKGNYPSFTVPQAADGSVRAEAKNPFNNRMIRLVVSAGFGPREFEAVDLYHGCRHRFRPW